MNIPMIRKMLLFVALLLFILVALGYTGSPRIVLLPVAFALWVISDFMAIPQ
jgi:hypothetical protein